LSAESSKHTALSLQLLGDLEGTNRLKDKQKQVSSFIIFRAQRSTHLKANNHGDYFIFNIIGGSPLFLFSNKREETKFAKDLFDTKFIHCKKIPRISFSKKFKKDLVRSSSWFWS
jgi:hypothetical protein